MEAQWQATSITTASLTTCRSHASPCTRPPLTAPSIKSQAAHWPWLGHSSSSPLASRCPSRPALVAHSALTCPVHARGCCTPASAAYWARARRAVADVVRRRIILVPRQSIPFSRNSEFPAPFRPTCLSLVAHIDHPSPSTYAQKCLVLLSLRSKSRPKVFVPSLKRPQCSVAYPAAALVSTFWLTFFQTINVGRARKRAKIPYPQRTLQDLACTRLTCGSRNHWQCTPRRLKQRSPRKLPSSTVHSVSVPLSCSLHLSDRPRRCPPKHTGVPARHRHGVRPISPGASRHNSLLLSS